MGVGAAIFESAGKRTEHFVPGVYSRSYNVTSPSGVSAGNLCIMGTSTGGEPCKLYEFGSISEAQETLISGELLDAVAYAFSGSNDYIPQRIYAMRVNGGTRAKLTLKAGSIDLLRLIAWDYGRHTNQLKIRIDNGTVTNSKKLTIVYKTETKEVDNIVRQSIKIVSPKENARVSIFENSISLSYTDKDETQTMTFNFDDFKTIGDLVAKINDSESFVAILLDTDFDFECKNLDTVSNSEIGEGLVLYSTFYEFKKELEKSEYLSKVETLSTSRIVPENISFTYFSDGATSPYSNEDWRNALSELETKDIQILATPNTEQDIQTLIVNHCTSMSSTVNRKERTCFLGGLLDEDDEIALSKAKTYNNKLCSYVVDSVEASNPISGKTEAVSGSILACMLAGMESSMAVHISLTNKTLKVLKFRKNRNITNLEKLIKGGVITCNPNPDNITDYVVIRAVTTYQQDDLISNERSMVREDLFMNRDLRKTFAPLIGTPNNASPSSIIQTLMNKGEEWADAGYIIRSDTNQAVWNISVKIDGDKIYLKFSRYLTAPTNFVFITVANYIYTSTVEL